MPTPRRTEWVKLWSRGDHPLLVVDGFLRGHRDFFGRYFRLPFRMRYYLRHSGETSFEVGELNALRRLIREQLKASWPEAMVRKMRRDLKRWTSYARRLNSRRVQRKQLEHFFHLQQGAWMSVYLPLLVGDVIEGELGKMTVGFGPARRERILRLAATPPYPTLQARYLQAVRRAAKLRGAAFLVAAERLTYRYVWVKGYLMNVKPLTVAMVRHDARALGQAQPPAPTVNLTHHPRLRRLVRLGRLYCWFRDWRLSAWNETFYCMKPFLPGTCAAMVCLTLSCASSACASCSRSAFAVWTSGSASAATAWSWSRGGSAS